MCCGWILYWFEDQLRKAIIATERTMLCGLLVAVPLELGILHYFRNAAEGAEPCQGLYDAMTAMLGICLFSMIVVGLEFGVDKKCPMNLDMLGTSLALVIVAMASRMFMGCAVCGLLLFTDFEGACPDFVIAASVPAIMTFLSPVILAWRLRRKANNEKYSKVNEDAEDRPSCSAQAARACSCVLQ
mmetsp:Transcript_11/g.16  ORF Transcript_11/g.16 Transcript_11/m.16 type:complete len:186 (-) Transcript_11:23-580(-)